MSRFEWCAASRARLAGLVVLGVALPLSQVSCSSARYSASDGAPSLVMPARFAEGEGEGGPAGSANAAPSSAAPASSPVVVPDPASTASIAPDPEPLRLAEQVEYELLLAEGKVSVVAVRTPTLSAPVVTPRRIGRYAIELGIGNELIERVRFDFPGTAGDEFTPGSKQSLSAPLTLSARAIARVKVLVPRSPRVRRALLVDRARGSVIALEWPFVALSPAPVGNSAAQTLPPATPRTSLTSPTD